MVKGFKQQFSIDYVDTFAPTIRSSTLCLLLSFTAQNGAAIHQCNVKNTYLNSQLKDNITLYSELTPKYEDFHKLPPNLKGKPNVADEAVFYIIEDNKFTIVAAATDDFSVIADLANSTNLLVQKQLTKCFEISDLGPINWLLDVNITQDLFAHTISLSQQAYIKQIINHFNLTEARIVTTPMEASIDLSFDSHHISAIILTPAEKTKYHEMIGCLMYTAVMTHPDISFAVSSLSQYLDTPCTTHLQAVIRVFHYLSGTKNLKLTLGGLNTMITGYLDSDWASQTHCHSISRFAFFIGMGIVSWSSKKQLIITLSSTEAEYVALTHSSNDIIWIHKLLAKFSTIFPTTLPTTLYCDNQGTIHLSKDSTFHGCTKHIDVHLHFIHQTVSQGHIALLYCPIDNMIVDTFTKPLAQEIPPDSQCPLKVHNPRGGVSLFTPWTIFTWYHKSPPSITTSYLHLLS